MPSNQNEQHEATNEVSPQTQNDDGKLHSSDLFSSARRLIIEHRGEDYCLRLTRNDRLILNKL